MAGTSLENSGTTSNRVVVGIGASAGGLAALKEFFHHIPERTGITYVVVMHLSAEHESHLAELLQPFIKIPVTQVTETVQMEPDHVYVIPPGCNLSAIDSHLRLSNLEPRRRERAPIDHFFRTLGATHDGKSVGVILSGTGSDGALGVKAIRERGGLTLVQDPAEAEYDGMPRTAIGTGLVDRRFAGGATAASNRELRGNAAEFAHGYRRRSDERRDRAKDRSNSGTGASADRTRLQPLQVLDGGETYSAPHADQSD